MANKFESLMEVNSNKMIIVINNIMTYRHNIKLISSFNNEVLEDNNN